MRGRFLALAVVFVAVIALEGCGTTHPGGASMVAAMPTMAPASPDASSSAPDSAMAVSGGAPAAADANAAWAARPAFVRSSAETEDAYSYAFHNPQIVQWMPCYCGCARIDHRSNLDCYLKRAVPGQDAQFEEHASYCEVCVRITQLTRQLVSQGRSLREVRQAVDETFGGSVAGTPTALPPA